MKSSDSRQQYGRVLLVDDHTQLRQMLALALHIYGFEVREAATSAEAFRWLATNRPAVVVLDLQSNTDGLTVLRTIRQRAPLDDLPLVFLASERTDELRWQALKAGADWFCFKPLSLRELQEHVGDLSVRGRPRLRALGGQANHRLAG